MIQKALEYIEPADFQNLVDDEVRENKTIEYKLQLPDNTNTDKARFLAVVSSFSNADGGDLLLGVKEAEGAPTEFLGIELSDPDKEVLRLDHIIANGLEPRLPRVDIRPVKLNDTRYVVVIRVAKSWTFPHRVKQNNHFYGRNSAGKYPLDVGEIRTAFTLSETIIERIRNFRTERIAKIYNDDGPVPLLHGGTAVLHLLPLSAFTETPHLDLSDQHRVTPPPLTTTGCSFRNNLDGVVSFSVEESGLETSYTQLFRSGMIEGVGVFKANHGLPLNISSLILERELIRSLGDYFTKLKVLNVEPPYYLFLTLVKVRGWRLAVYESEHKLKEQLPLREDMLKLPEVVIEDVGARPDAILRPAFDLIWNAFGFGNCTDYNVDGEWCL